MSLVKETEKMTLILSPSNSERLRNGKYKPTVLLLHFQSATLTMTFQYTTHLYV